MSDEAVKPSKRGFASWTPEKQRAAASKGGKSAHAKGRAHEFSKSEAQAAGRKGGGSHSREHMSEIGKKGAAARSRNLSLKHTETEETENNG